MKRFNVKLYLNEFEYEGPFCVIFKIFQFRFLVFPLLYHCDLPWLSSVLFFMGIASYQEFSMHNFSERFSDIQKARKNRGFRTQIFLNGTFRVKNEFIILISRMQWFFNRKIVRNYCGKLRLLKINGTRQTY